MKRKRSIKYEGCGGSIYLEDEFWDALKEVAKAKGMRRPGLVAQIARNRGKSTISSAVSVYVLEHFMQRARYGAGVIQESEDHIKKLRNTIEVLMARERGRATVDGLAPIATVIAGSRPNG